MSKASLQGMGVGRPSQARDRERLLEAVRQPEAEPVKRVNFEVPESLHRKLKLLAAREGLSIRDYLTAFIQAQPDPLG